MNKHTFETSNALGELDDSLVSEAARASKPKGRRLGIVLAAAAALVLALGLAVALPGLLKPKADDRSALAATEAPANTEETAPAPTEALTEAPVVITPAPVHETSAPTALPTQAYHTASQPVGQAKFTAVSAVALAVSSGYFDGKNEPLNGLTEIYMPKKVPYGAEFSDITITNEYVAVNYGISEDWISAEEDPNRFVFIWHRNWVSGTAESYAASRAGNYGEVNNKNGIWIIHPFSGVENYAVWEKDGKGFEIIVPGNYPEDSDIIGFTKFDRVSMDEAYSYAPAEGFEADGYMWLEENGMGIAPVSRFAYGTTYYLPEDGGEGSMLYTEGYGFPDGIKKPIKELPHVGRLFTPVLLEDTEIVTVNVYDAVTLEPIALDITLDELRDIAALNVSSELRDRICGACSGCVLVDVVVAHNRNFIPELNEYEIEAFHCGFILEFGN